MKNREKLEEFQRPDHTAEVADFIRNLLEEWKMPAPEELVALVESEFGLEARWDISPAIELLLTKGNLTGLQRRDLRGTYPEEALQDALKGTEPKKKPPKIQSSIDQLLRASRAYRSSEAFKEMIDFIALFRDYAPYNNMLVRVQNPSCTFYATETDWKNRFNRRLKEDARPMIILAPRHPVMLVYDLDQTEGKALPTELENFSRFQGEVDEGAMDRLEENAGKYGIEVQYKPLSSTHSGTATLSRGKKPFKMRVVIHEELDPPSRFGVLCHELAHVLLGHLGTDEDFWWPSRVGLPRRAIEVEAETVAYIVTNRMKLSGTSAAYLSGLLTDGAVPPEISLDLITKTAVKIERMAKESMNAPRSKAQKEAEKNAKKAAGSPAGPLTAEDRARNVF
jgi:hypothetical protein